MSSIFFSNPEKNDRRRIVYCNLRLSFREKEKKEERKLHSYRKWHIFILEITCHIYKEIFGSIGIGIRINYYANQKSLIRPHNDYLCDGTGNLP